MQFKRIMKSPSGHTGFCTAEGQRKSNVDSRSLYYSKNPVGGSLSLLKLKLLQRPVVVFAIPVRGAGNSWVVWGVGSTCPPPPRGTSQRPQLTGFVRGLKIA